MERMHLRKMRDNPKHSHLASHLAMYIKYGVHSMLSDLFSTSLLLVFQIMSGFQKKTIKRQPHPILYGPMNMLISNVVGDCVYLLVQALQHQSGKRI